MKILIKVTKDILRRSAMCKRNKVSTNCAIALAVQGVFPESRVRSKYIAIFTTNNGITNYLGSCLLPLDASLFIEAFDSFSPEQRLLMQPISFEIDVPAKVIDSIGISQVYKILSESKTLELVHP